MKRLIPFLLLTLVAVACETDGPTFPIDGPQFARAPIDCDLKPDHPHCNDDGGDPTVVETASGDYWMTVYRLPDGPYENRWFWFDASRYDDGSVSGTFKTERYSITTGRRVSKASGTINCFTIVGNDAWIGGTQKTIPAPNNHALWRVVDGAPDESSLVCNRMPGGSYYGCYDLTGYDSEMYCAATPLQPVLGPVIDSGTVVLEGVQ